MLHRKWCCICNIFCCRQNAWYTTNQLIHGWLENTRLCCPWANVALGLCPRDNINPLCNITSYPCVNCKMIRGTYMLLVLAKYYRHCLSSACASSGSMCLIKQGVERQSHLDISNAKQKWGEQIHEISTIVQYIMARVCASTKIKPAKW